MNRRPRWLAVVFGAAALASVDAHALDWAGLWSRPDQRAEHLLEAGNTAAAAALFQDPRRKAYAEIEAHHYADAAQRLRPYVDPLSSYNRGNALARAGHLHQALAAYDAALKRAPSQSSLYRDARHNRDLVAKQLASHKPPSGKKGGAKSGKKGAGQGKSPPSAGQQSSAQQSSGQGKQPPSQGQQASSNAAPGQPGAQKQAPSPGQSQASPAQGSSAEAKPGAAQKADAAQAKQDAAAARARQDLAGGRQSPPHPESERAMSLDQWLRWIPDDPGGLLRRKFMIEHMLHQEKSQR